MRRAAGHMTVGIKVGYANKAMWRVLKLDTLVWAHMYDDTVQYAPGNEATLSRRAHDLAEDRAGDRLQDESAARRWCHRAGRCARSRRMAGARVRDHRLPVRRLEVSARGLRRRLRPARRAHRRRAAVRSTAANIPELVEQLPAFKVRLSKDGERRRGGVRQELAPESRALPRRARIGDGQAGRGRNHSPRAISVSSGTLTESTPIQPAQPGPPPSRASTFPRSRSAVA